MSDHIHLLCDFPAKYSLSDMLRKIKSNSSHWIHLNFLQFKNFKWQSGYGAFSVSESQKAVVHNYINKQKEHHQQISFQNEFICLLEKHDVPYDPDVVWH